MIALAMPKAVSSPDLAPAHAKNSQVVVPAQTNSPVSDVRPFHSGGKHLSPYVVSILPERPIWLAVYSLALACVVCPLNLSARTTRFSV